MLVYVLSIEGEPLMPTKRLGKVRYWLNHDEAEIVSREPFTIQFKRKTQEYTQEVVLGIDAGYHHIGASAINTAQNKELYSEVFHQRTNEVENNIMRKMYRNNRRGRKRYRPCRNPRTPFTKTEGLAPSLHHKAMEHVKVVERIKKFLPVSNIRIEVGSIDPKETKAKFNGVNKSTIDASHRNRKELKAYIFARDGFTCQVCKRKKSQSELHCHHIIFKSKGGPNQPENLLTVCTKCHTPENHKVGHVLYKMMKTAFIPHFAGGYFMSVLTPFLKRRLEFEQTYGSITTPTRIRLGLTKEHYNDAFVIAGANSETIKYDYVVEITKLRRNNRGLSRFHDAKYLGLDGKTYSGQELNNGHVSRNRNKDNENKHPMRAHKIKKGTVRTRRQHYQFRPHDLVLWNGRFERVKSVISNGQCVALQCKKYPLTRNVVPIHHVNGNLYNVIKINT